MFKNIGGKIKKFAKVVCWLGIICSIICGIAVILYGATVSTAANQMGNFSMGETTEMLPGSGVSTIITGVIVMIVGSLASWVSSFMTYGFGELIDNSAKMVAILKKWEN